MSITNLMGIYPETISNIEELCWDMLTDIQNFIQRFGTEEEYYALRRDVKSEAFQYLKENVNLEDITNSIISAYFNTIADILGEIKTLTDLDLSFESYVNCDDSHFYIVRDNEETAQYCGQNDFDYIFNSALARKMAPQIANYLHGRNIEYPLDWIETDIQESNYDDVDIVNCIYNNQVTGSVKDTIEEVIKEEFMS